MSARQWKVGDYFYAPYVPGDAITLKPWSSGKFPLVCQVLRVTDDWALGKTIISGDQNFRGSYYFSFKLMRYASTVDEAEAMMTAHLLTGKSFLLGELTP